MREIKFRAWDGRKMVEVNSIDFSSSTKDIWYGYDGIGGESPVQPLMQFTGLLDKNGKEIYEGDIVSCSFYGLGEKWMENFQICFGEYGYYNDYEHQGLVGFYLLPTPEYRFLIGSKEYGAETYGFSHPKFQREKIVIGNIYENPELLKLNK